jgi:hypothetical protein
MRWFLALGAAVVVALSGAGPAGAPAAQPVPPDRVAPPSALVLVERVTTDEALAAVGPGPAGVAGFVSTLPVHQPLASRVLSLAAGRRVDALAALEDNPAAAAGLPDPATVARIRADNPGASLGRLPPTWVLAYPGLEVAGLFALGQTGPATAAGPLQPGDRPIPVRPGQLLVLAVPDAPALADVMNRVRPAAGAGPVMVVGLRAAPGRANAAPLLVVGQAGASGLPTSDSTRRSGLVALEDVRPTLNGGSSDGDDGTPIRIEPAAAPAAAALRIDRRVAALVVARTWAIPLLCLAAVLALFALVAVWRARRRVGPAGPGQPPSPTPRPTGGSGPEWVARALLALTLALPPGYLVASMVEPVAATVSPALFPGDLRDPDIVVPWAIAWVASGIAIATALTALALRLDRPSPNPPRARARPATGSGARPDARSTTGSGAPPDAPSATGSGAPPGARARAGVRPPDPRSGPRWGSVPDRGARFPRLSTVGSSGPIRAPVLLGAVLLGLVALDLVLGGAGLAQPLVGGSAWDGERFYGLGNGYFAFALAAAMLVIGFAPLRAVAAAALLAALGVVDGLPRLGADVGGALTAMLTAGAALVVLAPGRPRVHRVVLLAGLGVAAAVAVALGAGLGGPVTHAGRFAERLQQGPADAAGVVVDQLARNLRLLANSPFAWVGPIQIAAAGLIALRPPPPFRGLSVWIRRVLGLGAFGSLLLIVLNDTGVTATAASGLFLLAIPAWAWLDQDGPTGRFPSRPRTRPVEAHH